MIFSRMKRGGVRSWFLLLTGLALPLGVGASEIRVPPWFGDRAVLTPDFCGRPAAVLMDGDAPPDMAVRFHLSVSPQSEYRAVEPRSDRSDDTDGRWEIPVRVLSRKSCDQLSDSSDFSISLQGYLKRKPYGTARVLTNLAVGPVWLVYVDPETDRHEMPTVSEAARRRVRILSLPEGLNRRALGQWRPAGSVEQEKDPLFCGQPREFANEMAGIAGDQPVGIILVPQGLRERGRAAYSRSLMDQDRIERDYPAELHPDFRAGVAAAFNSRVRTQSRRKQFEAQVRERISDLKLRGIVAEVPRSRHVWEHVGNGGEAEMGFRVTGVIWGPDARP